MSSPKYIAITLLFLYFLFVSCEDREPSPPDPYSWTSSFTTPPRFHFIGEIYNTSAEFVYPYITQPNLMNLWSEALVIPITVSTPH